MRYHFGIDETGTFSFDAKQKSFVCGILISKNESTVKQEYKKVLQKFYPDQIIGDNTNDIIGKEQFHYYALNEDQKKICKNELLFLADKIFVSTGKPLLYANNQNYWQIAVTAVIMQLLRSHQFAEGDTLEIHIDVRAEMVWGMRYDDEIDFADYHEILKTQIETVLNSYRSSLGIEISVKFISDTKSFFVNLADIVCGIVREDKNIESFKCPCESVFSGKDPNALLKDSPVATLTIIFQEVLNEHFRNVGLVNAVLENSRNDEERYDQIWDLFFNYLKYQIKQRYVTASFTRIKEIIRIFLNEFKGHYSKIASEKRLDIVNAFVEYVSHNGDIETPFEKDFVVRLLDEGAETRIIRKWEKWISFHLRMAQVQANGYNFGSIEADFENLWEKQDKIIEAIDPKTKKDEHSTAIIGTLAQSYAYSGQIKNALDYFKLSLEYTIKTSNQTYFYLLTCHFINQDIEQVRDCFEKQSGQKAESFKYKQNADDSNAVWCLLSYAKLRALELHKNGKTDLQEILPRKSDDTAYPHPLILKWMAVALFIENADNNRERVCEYLKKGIDELLKDSNGFAIKTLALSLIQIFALVDNNNPYHARYNTMVASLAKESDGLKAYMDKKPLLKGIKNDASLWERAMALPFNYS